MTEEKDLRLVNTPNNIAKGKIEIDAQINRLYYNILNNIQRDNKELIIKTKKGEPLTQEQEDILKKLDTIQALSCKVSKEEINNIFKNNNYKTEEEIKERFNALQTAVFEFTTGEKSSRMAQLIGAVDINEDGYTVNLDAKLYKYLFYNLDVGYTPVNLATLFNLQGQYAQALYVLLRSWTGTKREIEFTIEELREYFKVGEKYKAYKNFKARVIMQAIEEINKTGSMIIEDIKERKKGRSVVAVTFIVNDLEPRVMPIGNKTKELPAPATRPATTAPATEKATEPILWLDYIKLDSKELMERLERRYGGDYDFNSPFIKACFTRAYDKTIRHDGTFDRIQDRKGATNLALFNKILADELFTHEQSIINSLNEEPSIEAELYASAEDETTATSSGVDYDDLERKLLGWDTEE